ALKPVLARFGDGVIANRRFLGYYEGNRRALQRPGAGRLKDVYLMQIVLAWLVAAPLLAALAARLQARLVAHGLARPHATAIALAVALGSMALYYSSTYSGPALACAFAWHAVLSLLPAPGISGPGRGACLAAGAPGPGSVGVRGDPRPRPARAAPGRDVPALLRVVQGPVRLLPGAAARAARTPPGPPPPGVPALPRLQPGRVPELPGDQQHARCGLLRLRPPAVGRAERAVGTTASVPRRCPARRRPRRPRLAPPRPQGPRRRAPARLVRAQRAGGDVRRHGDVHLRVRPGDARAAGLRPEAAVARGAARSPARRLRRRA